LNALELINNPSKLADLLKKNAKVMNENNLQKIKENFRINFNGILRTANDFIIK